MPHEIERKFLVKSDAWRGLGTGVKFRQGYLSRESGRTVRVRIAGEEAYLTIKGPAVNLKRLEFEYPIPVAHAEEMLGLCVGPLIEKTRVEILHAGRVWEVDEFFGENEGLIVAEIELDEASDSVELPDWVGAEVSSDPRYFNSNLSVKPYRSW